MSFAPQPPTRMGVAWLGKRGGVPLERAPAPESPAARELAARFGRAQFALPETLDA